MMPTFTGRSTVGLSPRSGMKERNGTPMKRVLSRIQAEFSGASSERMASCSSSRWVSKPCGSVWGGYPQTGLRAHPPGSVFTRLMCPPSNVDG